MTLERTGEKRNHRRISSEKGVEVGYFQGWQSCFSMAEEGLNRQPDSCIRLIKHVSKF
jgi:hypothetical protein